MNIVVDKNKGEILVVDDNQANLKLLIEILSLHGYKVRPSSDGEQALAAVAIRQPELILLDIKMPGIDGYEVCRRLKSDSKTRDIPVIFISALDALSNRVKGFELGAVDYIAKPFQPEEVLVRVHTHMQLHKMQTNLEELVDKRTHKIQQLNKQLVLSRDQEERARQKAEQAMITVEIANERLQELDKLKSMFIASMSHELRTPLNAIIGFSGLILQGITGELNSKQKDSMERIHRAGNHLLELITNVIDIARIEAGRIETFPEHFQLKELIEEAIKTIRLQAEKKGLSLEIKADTWPEMNTDRKRLKQCLFNYLDNAVKFTETGKVTLSVFVEEDMVDMQVIDTGIGIEKEALPKLFEAFEQLETHLRVKAGGTGLGLYLTKKIIEELLHGSVLVESRIDEGSIFGLRIPIDVTNDVQENGHDSG